MPQRSLGADFAGVLVRDGWAPYRRFTAALHQTCAAHLLRRARQLQADHPHSPWAAGVQAVLQAALELRDRRDAGRLTDHGLASVRGRLLARLSPADRQAAGARRRRALRRPSGHRISRGARLSLGPGRSTRPIGAPNRPSGPAVVTRKVCGGNRTRHGADTQQVLASVVRTAPPDPLSPTHSNGRPHRSPRDGRDPERRAVTDRPIPNVRLRRHSPGKQRLHRFHLCYRQSHATRAQFSHRPALGSDRHANSRHDRSGDPSRVPES